MKNNECPVLPIGTVNLTTAKNAMFGTMWDCWEQDARSSNILLMDNDTFIEKRKFRAVHSSGATESYYPVNSVMHLKHDQTGQRIGSWSGWRILGHFPHTPEGLLAMKASCGKAGISFATFK